MAEDPKIVNDFRAIHDHIQHAKRHLHEADTITWGTSSRAVARV